MYFSEIYMTYADKKIEVFLAYTRSLSFDQVFKSTQSIVIGLL